MKNHKPQKRRISLGLAYDIDEGYTPKEIATLCGVTQNLAKTWYKEGMTEKEETLYFLFINTALQESLKFENSQKPTDLSSDFTEDEIYRIHKFAEKLFRKRKTDARQKLERDREHDRKIKETLAKFHRR